MLTARVVPGTTRVLVEGQPGLVTAAWNGTRDLPGFGFKIDEPAWLAVRLDAGGSRIVLATSPTLMEEPDAH